MKTLIYTAMVSALLLSSWVVSAATAKPRASSARATQAAIPKGDPVLGREKAEAERCMECHGEDGNGAGHSNGPEGKFAKLAGQAPAYILKQIQDFRSGARQHDQMAIMARSVADEDIVDIAAYFGSLPRMKGDGQGAAEAGRVLFEQGDATRGVVACASCHGVQGQGVAGNPLTPMVGGQEWRYLDKQLRDWRSGDRRNSADGVMSQVLKPLTDTDIEHLTNYLSAQ